METGEQSTTQFSGGKCGTESGRVSVHIPLLEHNCMHAQEVLLHHKQGDKPHFRDFTECLVSKVGVVISGDRRQQHGDSSQVTTPTVAIVWDARDAPPGNLSIWFCDLAHHLKGQPKVENQHVRLCMEGSDSCGYGPKPPDLSHTDIACTRWLTSGDLRDLVLVDSQDTRGKKTS